MSVTVTFENMICQIGINVYWYRNNNGQSRSDLAKASGLTVETVSDIETYKQKKVTDEELTALAKGLGVEKDTLIGDHRTPSSDPEDNGDHHTLIGIREGKKIQYQKGLAMARQILKKKGGERHECTND